MKNKILYHFFLSLILILPFNFQAKTLRSVRTGNWYSTTTWDAGAIPSCGDIIQIASGHTVALDAQVNLSEAFGCAVATFIQIEGTLFFDNGNKIRLACGSGVEVLSGGVMQPDVVGGSNNLLEICSRVEWRASDGTVNGPALFGSTAPLASELISFTVEKNDRYYRFSWDVKSEFNVDIFKIIKSENGEVWTDFGSLKSVGNHDEVISYSTVIEDISQTNGTKYFKLVEVDLNGNEKILSTVSFTDVEEEFNVFPNPVKKGEDALLTITSNKEMEQEIVIVNSLGQEITKNNLIIRKGKNSYSIGSEFLETGIYFILIDKNKAVYRLIVRN